LAQSALDTSAAERRKGMLAAVLSSFAYSTAVLWVRYAYAAGITPGTAIFLRFGIASAVLVTLLKTTRRWVALRAGQARALFTLGLLTYTFMGIGWFTALSMIPVWLVSLFVALFPLPIAIGSWLFLREPLGPRQTWALAAVVFGGATLFWRPLDGATWAGVLLMLMVVATNTLYVLVGQRWTRGAKAAMTAVYTTLGATCGTFVYAILSTQLGFEFAPIGWLWTGLFAVVSTAVSILLLWESIARIGPARAAIIGALEPLFSIVLSVVILGERTTLLQTAGGGLIRVGVLLVQLPGRGRTDG
jgi:drug/metabolite transporter (DMT)-like permease